MTATRWLCVALLTTTGALLLLLAFIPTVEAQTYYPVQHVPYTGGADVHPGTYTTTPQEVTSHA